jgi:hypothetical protein
MDWVFGLIDHVLEKYSAHMLTDSYSLIEDKLSINLL